MCSLPARKFVIVIQIISHTFEGDWEIRFGNLSLLVNSISTDLDN